jgi:ABC-type multidrug transport system fused ATPase/permease subunit
MLVNRLAGLVLPASSKFLVDDVIGRGRAELLVPLALAAGAATIVDAATAFALSQVLGVAAQRAIANMRMSLQRHITRLPTSYFDSTQTGVLISRVMNDADGIRNLVGSGLVQLVGGLVTAVIALAVLFYLNWQLTLISIVVLAVFATGMIVAFGKLRPLFRARGKITADISGRLAESFGGIRIVKAYTAENREDRVFETGVMSLFANVRKTLTGISAVTAFGGVVIGAIGVVMMVVGGRAILAGTMTLGDFIMYIFFVGMLAAPLIQMSSIGTQLSEAMAGLDRIREIKAMATEDDEDQAREPLGALDGRSSSTACRSSTTPASRSEEHIARRARRHHNRAGRVERLWKEHADQSHHGLQPSNRRTSARGRPRSRWRAAARLPRAARRRPAGQLHVRRHGGRKHPLFPPECDDGAGEGGQPHRPLRRVRRTVSERVRHRDRRARREALGRAAAARRDRPGNSGGSARA